MIAEIQDPFVGEALNRKIDYQLKKIESGVARELYNSSGDSLINMYRNMSLVAGLNDRVKSPYIEFILSSPIGEDLPDEKFSEVAKEVYLYLTRFKEKYGLESFHEDFASSKLINNNIGHLGSSIFDLKSGTKE